MVCWQWVLEVYGKHVNAGTTWSTALTDNQSFYSTGSITIDPNNTVILYGWVLEKMLVEDTLVLEKEFFSL